MPKSFGEAGLLARLDVGHQTHETFVLVILVMAVQQRRPWIVGDEIDLYRTKASHIDRVLHYACRGFVAELGNLERVPMQMDRMVVAAFVGHDKAVALSSLRREQRICCRP